MKTKINETFAWEIFEHSPYERSKLWYLTMGIFILAAVVYGVMNDAWTFSIAILVLAGTYAVMHYKKPKKMRIDISKKGLKIDNHLLPFSEIKAFWINEISGVADIAASGVAKTLYVRMHKRLSPDLVISVRDTDICELRKFLSMKIPELQGKGENFSDILARLLKI